MKTKKNITGIILAGGKSSRMGSDKGQLHIKGKLFIEQIIDVISPFVSKTIIVSDHSDHDRFDITRVEDIVKDAGPLAGVYSGLYHSTTEENLFLSCDIPLINSQVIDVLIEENDPSFDVVQIGSKNRTMPLIALYKKRCQALCKELLDVGERRLQVFVDQLKTNTVILDEDLEQYTFNVNTKQDLKVLNNEFDN